MSGTYIICPTIEQEKREGMEPASGCCGTGTRSPPERWQIRTDASSCARYYSRHREQAVNIKSLFLRSLESPHSLIEGWDAPGIPIMVPCMQNCLTTVCKLTLHQCQGTGVTGLVGYPTTRWFPASQRLPPSTNPFSAQLPFQGLLTLSAQKSCPAKLPLTFLNPPFFYQVLRKAVCIHCLLLRTMASL